MPSNGKGDASRVTNQSAYAANFDGIDWGHEKDKTVVHAYDFRKGEFVLVSEVHEDRSKPNPNWVDAPPFVEHEAEWQHIPDNTPRRDEVVDRPNLGGQIVNDIPIKNDITRE